MSGNDIYDMPTLLPNLDIPSRQTQGYDATTPEEVATMVVVLVVALPRNKQLL